MIDTHLASRGEAVATTSEFLPFLGSRINWGGIFGGAVLALGIYFLLAILSGAVGLSISDRVNPIKLQTGALIWTILITSVALFVGGIVTSFFIVGENKVEAILHGAIMWSAVCLFLLTLGTLGSRSGFVAIADSNAYANNRDWEASARDAGVSVEQIEDWRRKSTVTSERMTPEMKEAATRATWYAFAGTWISMLAAALGSIVGMGTTFRILPAGHRHDGTLRTHHQLV